MDGCRFIISLATALIAALLLIACGHTSQRRIPSSALQPASINLADAVAQLDAMQAPEVVDAAVFAQLKNSLRAALIARGEDKIVSTPPTGASNAIPDFTLTDIGGGMAELTWSYYNEGDYNQDGIVSVADITPLAIHFGEGWAIGQENSLHAVVDGSGNGTVDIADVTPIAMNFGVEAAGFLVQQCDTENGEYTEHGYVLLAEGLDRDTARMHYTLDALATHSFWYHVMAHDSSMVNGIPSNNAQLLVAGSPSAALVADVYSGSAPLTVNLNASASTDPDGTIVKYEWDPEGDGFFNYDTSATPTTSTIYTVPGEYHPAVRVTDNDAKTDIASTTIIVTEHPPLPVASIVPSVNFGVAPLDVTLDASGSTDDGTIVKYEWDYEGDGVFDQDTGTTSSANYTYTTEGHYFPAVRVTDGDGGQDTAVTNLTVTFAPWVHTWGTSANEYPNAAAEGAGGNICMAGWGTGSKGTGHPSALIWLYSPDGNLIWARAWETGADQDDVAADITADGTGIYVVGQTTSVGNTDAILVKLDYSGAPLWQVSFGGGTANDQAFSVDLDGLGNIYVAGHTDTADVTGGAFVAKFDSVGVPIWQSVLDYNNGSDNVADLAVDADGNVYAVVNSDGLGSLDDVVLVKYDADGNIQWQTRWYGPDYDDAIGVAVAPDGNIYVTGATLSFGEGQSDTFLLKFTSLGILQVQQIWGGPSIDDPFGIAIDQLSGDIYVSGETGGFGVGGAEIFLLRYSSLDVLNKQFTIGNSGNEGATGLMLSSRNELYIPGYAMNNSMLKGDILGTSSETSAPASSEAATVSDPGWFSLAISGTLTDQAGVIDTGGGGNDALLIKENPLLW